MNRPFATPFIIFYPYVSRDGQPFGINKGIRKLKHKSIPDGHCWHGNLIIAKFSDQQFSAYIDATMADYPIIKNWLLKTSCHMYALLITL